MALRNQPYLPLFVDDFLTDEKLNECSALAHGVYIKLMCVMHKSQTYGKILLKQKDKQNSKQIINFALKLDRYLPFTTTEIEAGLSELLTEEVIYIEGDYLCQKRMVKDNKISELRAKAGSKGGIKKNKKDKDFATDFAIAKTQANHVIGNEDVIGNESEDYPEDCISSYSQLMTSKQMENEKFLKAWSKWILFNDERETRITPMGAKEQLAFMESKNNEPEIILKAITNNWKGLNYNGAGTNRQRRKDFVSTDEITSELTEAFTKKT